MLFIPPTPMDPRILVFITGPLLCASAASGASVIDSIYGNGAGSFEIPDPNIAYYENYGTGSTDLTGWTVGSGSVDWVRNTVWNASHGNYSIDMNGTVPPGDPPSVGSIFTMFSTTIGASYRVTFDIAGFLTDGNMANPKGIDVNAAGVTTHFSLTTTDLFPPPLNLPLTVTWSTRVFEFTATQATTTLTFTSTITSDHSGMLLDNVAVEAVQPVPEPSAAALVLFAACGYAGRRRR